MRYLLKFVVVLAALVWMAAVLMAGPYEDGVAAAKRGDYATALQIFRSLAEQGDAKGQNGLGVAIVSTSQGVMSDRQARAAGQGGEVLCIVS